MVLVVLVNLKIDLGLQMMNPEYTDFPKYILNNTLPRSGGQTRSGLMPFQVHNIWPVGLTGGTYLVFRLLNYSRLARCCQTNSDRPDGRISGHLWECMARSCADKFGDGRLALHGPRGTIPDISAQALKRKVAVIFPECYHIVNELR